MNVTTYSKNVFRTALMGAFLVGSPAAFAEAKINVDKPDFDNLQSPEVGGNTGRKNFKPKDWLEMEVKFNVEAVRPEPKDDFVDRVQIRWYVAVQNPGGRDYWLLEKEVTHVNVPVGEDLYASIYLSPNSVRRLSGGDRASKNIIDRVGGEINVAGTTVYFSSKGKAGWWQSGQLSRTDKVPLLNKSETPFKMLWWDRYAEVEAERR